MKSPFSYINLYLCAAIGACLLQLRSKNWQKGLESLQNFKSGL